MPPAAQQGAVVAQSGFQLGRIQRVMGKDGQLSPCLIHQLALSTMMSVLTLTLTSLLLLLDLERKSST